MDNAQEQLARSLGDGHRVIHGVAGSGKTLILQYRAKELAAENDSDKPILVICFNILLARILASRLKNNRIEVLHFHDWCKLQKERYQLKVISGEENYPERLAATICAAVEDGTIAAEQYHAVLIDEGHDMAADWLRALAKMPDSKHERLLLLYDDAQTLYPNRHGIGFTLSSVGIKAPGRTRILHTNYRNSKEIHEYAMRFIHHFLSDTPIATEQPFNPFNLDEQVLSITSSPISDDAIPMVASQSGGGYAGIEPQYYRATSRKDEIGHIIKMIHTWKQEGAAYGDIAVLCYTKHYGQELVQELQEAALPMQNLIEKTGREQYAPERDKLNLCTLHSSKGGEFHRVIIAGIDTLPDKKEQQEASARLIYVGITRAQNHLLLTAAADNTFTALLHTTSE
ncbi:MAG: 3'-5' exonuclease [Cardiobacteriaceae bacterium]|nr:3'-5' exonuclease [Cardiobacteriaceae bacterium]